MLQVSCQDVSSRMPPPLLRRVSELMIQRTGEDITTVCEFIAQGETVDAVMDQVTAHVREQHALRSWPPEYWIHIRACIHQVGGA